MVTDTIRTVARTTAEGELHLHLDPGWADRDVAVTVQWQPDASATPARRASPREWPTGYFEELPGSMPELRRAPQGTPEPRRPLQ